jgi:DMSO/TMAO reductase YedYZ molybdopterin-dependent catalytic subunit
MEERQLFTHAHDSRGQIRAAESPLSAAEGLITPTRLFYVVHHYDAPQAIEPEMLDLEVTGAVRNPYHLTYSDLSTFPSRTVIAMVECAGAGRKYLNPVTPGTPLGNGTASMGEWTGVPLASLISRADPPGNSVGVVVEGRDRGTAQPEAVEACFAKGLPWEKAVAPDTIIAWALNGEPLSHLHGSPIRLVVPGWYGVWWVKWIRRLEILNAPFNGFWQGTRYVYDWQDGRETSLVTVQRVKSVITQPQAEEVIRPGEYMVRGYAWSGSGSVVRVELSIDGGRNWQSTSLLEPRYRWGWTRWEYAWRAVPGEFELCSRATDDLGQTQPSEPAWNRLGYGNNAIQKTRTVVR